MKRRAFLCQGVLLTTAYHFSKLLPYYEPVARGSGLYEVFKNPTAEYRPFVRWWWNGDKIQREEIARELRLLKDAGIGGVEINPVKFPAKTNDLGSTSVPWLSNEWIDLLKFAFNEARSLGLTCDLIVGSGWPLGAEWLQGEERSQIVVIGTKKLEGPLDYEVSLFDLFKEADPAISSPFPGRKMEMLSVKLVPSPINSVDEVQDLSDQIPNAFIRFKIPKGKFVLYALVKISGFMEVIQGAPGATGPVLNHYNQDAVRKYLRLMSGSIQEKLGPLPTHIRSLFSDSLELEGSNWCEDMQAEFQQRRGYDLMPWLPFLLFKIAGMGNTYFYDHGAELGDAFNETVCRVRYDFELTRTELLKERFVDSFMEWCKENKVQSRVQGYGRGYFPLEGSFEADIPECETWIRPGLGTDMSETEYWFGRAYTMINKYVSSAAHLKGRKKISCEELTNIHSVFNETLEIMKIAGDQSLISGSTHAVFHGFNYSPPNAEFPGWVLYGTFMNERNPWWPYFHYFTKYKTRLFAVLQQAIMFADIAVLPAITDLWSIYGAQNEPFPAIMHPWWQTLIWEVIHQNGGGCDYVSEQVIRDARVEDGYFHYGPRKYHTIFLTGVERIEPATAKRLVEFVKSGGKIFCIATYPQKAPGLNDHQRRDMEVSNAVSEMKKYPDRFVLLDKPEKDFGAWYKTVQLRYSIPHYLKLDSPNRFITQVRYQANDAEILLIVNSNVHESYKTVIIPSTTITTGRKAWMWDPETGERSLLEVSDKGIELDMAPADLKLIVFDKNKKGKAYKPVNTGSNNYITLTDPWLVEAWHVDGTVMKSEIASLKDLKHIPEWTKFAGTIIYRTNFDLGDLGKFTWLNLGKAHGVSELLINGHRAGTRWYGRRIYTVDGLLKDGNNNIEVKITTTLGNYLKSLTNNPVAQFWTNQGRTIQPVQSMGLSGPVTIY